MIQQTHIHHIRYSGLPLSLSLPLPLPLDRKSNFFLIPMMNILPVMRLNVKCETCPARKRWRVYDKKITMNGNITSLHFVYFEFFPMLNYQRIELYNLNRFRLSGRIFFYLNRKMWEIEREARFSSIHIQHRFSQPNVLLSEFEHVLLIVFILCCSSLFYFYFLFIFFEFVIFALHVS